MSETTTHSTRFTRAARAESERLLRRQRRATERVRKVEDDLAAAQAELDTISQRLQVLSAFTDDRPELRSAPTPDGDGRALTGADIRRVAVEALIDSAHPGPIHYRRWLEMLEDRGYRVIGKRPDAVFLGQVMRSPVVKATTNAGFYQLDEDAPRRLGERVSELERRMVAVRADRAVDPDEIEREMERRQLLDTELRRAQRELKEALTALGRSGTRLAA